MLKTETVMVGVKNFFRNDEGVTAIEYAFIAALIAAVLILTLTTLGTNLKAPFSNVSTRIPVTIS